MKEPFVCTYCQRKCRLIGIIHDNRIPYWRCDYHGAVVVKFMPSLSDGEKWLTVIMALSHRELKYHVCFFYDNPYVQCKFRIDRFTYTAGSAGAVLQLDFHPENITPENVQQKLPTLLLFS